MSDWNIVIAGNGPEEDLEHIRKLATDFVGSIRASGHSVTGASVVYGSAFQPPIGGKTGNRPKADTLPDDGRGIVPPFVPGNPAGPSQPDVKPDLPDRPTAKPPILGTKPPHIDPDPIGDKPNPLEDEDKNEHKKKK